jgi:DDE superfamily endonuclease/Tc5 transposase DNA-binding domain
MTSRVNNQKQTRRHVSIDEKIKILDYKLLNPDVTQLGLTKKFNISLGTINSILKKEKDLRKICENKRNAKNITQTKEINQKLFNVLFEWFNRKRLMNHILTDDLLTEKALSIANAYNFQSFKASNTWLRKFKQHFLIINKTVCGEAGLVKVDDLKNSWSDFEHMKAEFESRNIYNCDETSLFFKCPSKKTLVLSKDDRACGKFAKDRITLLFCANLSGQKEIPLLIGKAQRPHGFKHLNLNDLGLDYKNSKKAWMTSTIFFNWMNQLNDRMQKENRKILLILDNAPVHNINSTFSNVQLYFLPPTTTSQIQPLDQGIIRSFKANYRKFFMRNLTLNDEKDGTCYANLLKNTKLKDILSLIIEAWNCMSAETITNCFNKAFNNWSKNTVDIIDDDIEDTQENQLDVDFPTCNEYIEHDDLNSEEICIDEIQPTEEKVSEEEEEKEKLVSYNEVISYINLVEAYMLQNSCTDFINLGKVKEDIMKTKKRKGMKITDYFNKKIQ